MNLFIKIPRKLSVCLLASCFEPTTLIEIAVYCGEKDSIDHTFRDCHFVKIFIQRVINWFNIENKIKFNPSSEERLFGILSDLHVSDT